MVNLRRALILIVISLPIFAWADTRAIFGTGDSKATVLMLAISENPDSIAFYSVMNLPEEVVSGKTTKRFQFTDPQGFTPLTVVCAFSQLSKTTGSCTLTFKPAQGILISSQNNQIAYRLEGSEAQRLANYFVWNNPLQAFRSSDGLLVIQAERDKLSDAISAITIHYGQ